mgnify:FL=1
MGTWGPAIFSNDTASDVRGDYRDHIGDGLSSEEATSLLEREYCPDRDDLEQYCPFWLGLAAAQFQVGRLTDRAKNAALEIIRDELDLDIWKESGEIKRRKTALNKLYDQLNGPQKRPISIKKTYKATCEWPVGSLVSYQLISGNYIVFRVGAILSDKGGEYPQVEVLDWIGGEIPREKDVRFSQVLSHTISGGGTRLLVCRSSERGLPKARLELIRYGNGGELKWSPPIVTHWKDLDTDLNDGYSLE